MRSIPGVRIILFGLILYGVSQCALRSAEPVAEAERPAPSTGSDFYTMQKERNASVLAKLEQISFKDERLKDCIKRELQMQEGAITSGRFTDPTELSRLDCRHQQISQLHGLEAFTNLKTLYLQSNPISYLEPLKPLAQLETLDLSNTQVTSVWQISHLANLTKLKLSGAPIEDLRPLLDFPSLKELDYKINRPFKCSDLDTFFGSLRSSGKRLYLPSPTSCLDSNNESVRY